MKKRLLFVAACAVLATQSAPAQTAGALPKSNDEGHSRFWDYYKPTPSNYIGSTD